MKSKKGACSAHIEKAKANCLRHNRRDYDREKPGYIKSDLTRNNRTVFEHSKIKNRKSIVPLVREAEKLYTEKTRQKCQKSFAPYREDVLVFPNRPDITDLQLMSFKEKVEQETGWQVMGIWMHLDEGHRHSKYIEGDDNFELNVHAHVLYYCQNEETGKAMRNDRKFFRLRQDWLAEASGMERGNYASETGVRHMNNWESRQKAWEERMDKMVEMENAQKIRLTALKEEADELATQNVEKRSERILGGKLIDFSWTSMNDPQKKILTLKLANGEDERISGVSSSLAKKIGKERGRLLYALVRGLIKISDELKNKLGIGY